MTQITKLTQPARITRIIFPILVAGQIPSQTKNDHQEESHVGESKSCRCRKDGGAKSDGEVARVEGRVYCLRCALLIPATERGMEEEEKTKENMPQVRYVLYPVEQKNCVRG